MLARRQVLLNALPFALVLRPSRAPALTRLEALETRALEAAAPSKRFVDPLFGRLRNRYILLRPGETTFEAAGIVDSNPINKASFERGLTARGRAQVAEAADALRSLGVDTPTIFYDNGARAMQSADIIAEALTVPRYKMEPEFRWLEARGLGALDGTKLREASAAVAALDALDISNEPPPGEDGTPNDSVNAVFSRLRNTGRRSRARTVAATL